MISNSTSLLSQRLTKKILYTALLWLILFCSSPLAQMSGTYTIGTGGNFSNLKAFFDNINTSGVSGNVTGNIISNLSESSIAVLNEVNYTGGPWTITIKPVGGSWVVSGTIDAWWLIHLNGADNVIIDGNIGGVKSLTLRNYSHTLGAGVIMFQNCATYNTLKNCFIQGAGMTNGGCTVHLANSTAGIEGNSYNTISNNDVGNIPNTGTFPSSGITSAGTAAIVNKNNTITNNNVFNFVGQTGSQDAHGIRIHSAGNGGGWNISGNSIYFNAGVPTNGQGGIYFQPGVYKTDDNLIYGNYIGGSEPQCGGAPWINDGGSGRNFNAIGMVTVDTSAEAIPTIIRKNTFKNIQFINPVTHGFRGIMVANGKTVVDSNIIGDPLVPNSIINAGIGNSGGIRVQGAGYKIVENNSVCNITLTNSINTVTLDGIVAGTPGYINITNNKIHHLKTFSTVVSSLTPAVVGIVAYGDIAVESAGEITGNTVYALVDSCMDPLSTYVVGIGAGNYRITRNLIYDLQNAAGVSYPPPTATGILITNGYTPQNPFKTLIANNMIKLGSGLATNTVFNGIWSITGNLNYIIDVHFNSVFITGANSSGLNSFGLVRGTYYTTQPLTMISGRNNIFVNMRTGSGKHYAIGNLAGDATGWGTGAFDYNLFNTANANTIGLWGTQDATFSSWKSISNSDSHGLVGDPQFENAANNNLHISTTTPTLVEGAGIPVAEVTTDFDGNTRNETTPDIGADEGNFIATPVELTSFTAELSGSNVLIKWMTSTEINNKGFDVERKLKAKGSWEKIGYTPGFGTTIEPKTYSFTDNKITSGTYSYRLKQIDYDGTYEYSPEVEVSILAPKEFSLSQNYPNPFNPSTIIKYALPFESNVKLTVYNLLGEVVDVLQNGIQEMGYYNISWNAESHSSGLYIYTIDAKSVDGNNSYSSVKKMMLVR